MSSVILAGAWVSPDEDVGLDDLPWKFDLPAQRVRSRLSERIQHRQRGHVGAVVCRTEGNEIDLIDGGVGGGSCRTFRLCCLHESDALGGDLEVFYKKDARNRSMFFRFYNFTPLICARRIYGGSAGYVRPGHQDSPVGQFPKNSPPAAAARTSMVASQCPAVYIDR